MLYSTGSSHLLSAILTRATGESTLGLARAWLGEPEGVQAIVVTKSACGLRFTTSGGFNEPFFKTDS